MLQKLVPETGTRNLLQKLARKFDASSSQFLAWKQLSGQSCCRVRVTCPDSFCAGIELCSIVCKKLVPEKTCTRFTDTRASFWNKFLERVLPALVYCWRFTNDDTAVFIGTVWLVTNFHSLLDLVVANNWSQTWQMNSMNRDEGWSYQLCQLWHSLCFKSRLKSHLFNTA